MLSIKFSALNATTPNTLVLFSYQNKELLSTTIDADTQAHLVKAMSADDFTGRYGRLLRLIAPNGVAARHIVLVGLGDPEELNSLKLKKLGGKLVAMLESYGETEALVMADAAHCLEMGCGAQLRQYAFDRYQNHDNPELTAAERNRRFTHSGSLQSFTFACQQPEQMAADFANLSPLCQGTCHARELVSEPANVLYPEAFAERVQALSEHGLEIEVLDEKELKNLGFGALLGVGQGSAHSSCLVIMRWQRGKSGEAPVALVGKGVTFDAGGIDIKPAKGMAQMKMDMGGAAAVVGLMETLARQQAPVNAVGVIGLVENMPSGCAMKASDVITSLSGKTIEIVNTDAEGRLVLCDALWYTQDRFKPRCIIDLATLTGGVIAALGHEYAGLFCNDDSLAQQLTDAGLACGEKVWRFPMGEGYERLLDSDIADLKNATNTIPANSISAAQFIENFVREIPWAHIDIAGTAWRDKADDLCRKGATGFGVRLLHQWLLNETSL